VVLELKGAEAVGDVLDSVGLPVGIVIGRVDAPAVAGAGVGGAQDPIEHRVAHIDVAGRHVDLGAQDLVTVGKSAVAHRTQELQVLLDITVAMRARRSRLGQSAAVGPDLLGRQVVDVGIAGLHELFGPFVELLEVVGGVVEMLAPVTAEPAHVLLDRFDVFELLLDRVGVVETEVTAAAELLGDAKAEEDRLGVTDVEIAVRLRGEAGHDPGVLAARQILADDLADEVQSFAVTIAGGRHMVSVSGLHTAQGFHRTS
jgi:hypothetical protein